jgi:hypothetical protein
VLLLLQITFTKKGENKSSVITASTKVAAHNAIQSGTIEAKDVGRFDLTWDNTYSYWTEKVLLWRVDTAAPSANVPLSPPVTSPTSTATATAETAAAAPATK